MPMYTYRCPACGREEVKHRTIEYRDDRPLCDHRSHAPGIPMNRIVDAPMGIVKGPAVPRGNG